MHYTQEHLDKWNRVLNSFREELNEVRFNTWFKPMELYAVTGDEVVVLYKDSLSMAMMMKLYFSRTEAMVRTLFGMEYTLKVYDANTLPKEQELGGSAPLNPKYTFDNFVVGQSNNFAFAASLAVAEQPSEIYNPLFIYGDVGLGKTHLMNAIGNYIKAENPMANVLLTTSEHFANELIGTIINKKGGAELRNRMRNVDVLMVDDIQFFSKTTATQEEFFHTFNDLHAKGKQIIISSDRPPKELPAIADRLRSRFEWGLIVDIQKPDFETRVAILRKKADAEFMDIPYEVIEYIASHFDKSIRELEGALTRIQAQAELMDDPITLELAMNTLSSLIKTPDARKVTPERIMEFVCRKYNVEVEDMLSKKRNREIAVPRQIAIYICRELTDMSTTNIGKAFGNRDHTTVMHSCEKVAEQAKDDYSFKKKLEELMEMIRNS